MQTVQYEPEIPLVPFEPAEENEQRYSDDQERDPDGKWGSGGSAYSGEFSHVTDLTEPGKHADDPTGWKVGGKVESPKGIAGEIVGHTKSGAIVKYASGTQVVIKMGGGWKLKRSLVDLHARLLELRYSPDQPRDPDGKFGDGDAGVSFTHGAKTLDMKSGLTLSYTPHPYEQGGKTYHVKDGDKKVGEITLDKYEDVAFPSIRQISLDKDYQGKGIGKQVIQTLAEHYGGLTSDPQGNTNDHAKGMWKSAGGKEVESTHNFSGKMFQLKRA